MKKNNNLTALPASIEAEQAVLGGLMLAPEKWSLVSDWLSGHHFFRDEHHFIFQSISDLIEAGKPVDAVTMGEWFEVNGFSDQISGNAYLIELASTTPSAANLVAYAEIVVEKWRQRIFIEICTDGTNAGLNPNGTDLDSIITATLNQIADLSNFSSANGPQGPKLAMQSFYDELAKRWESKQSMTGEPSPWHDLNAITFGWQPNQLIIVAARPNVGKSVLGFNQLAFTGLRGKRALGFSLEMTYEELLGRMVASLGDIPHNWIRSPANFPGEDYFPEVSSVTNKLQSAAFMVDDSARLTASQIVARAKREHVRAPLSLIVIDHLHDMKRPGKDLVNEIADDCRTLKALAKELNVPVILLCQLNRQGADRPTLKDLRGSGGIEEVADLVIMMHREDYQKFDTGTPAPVELIISKGRNLPAGKTVFLKNRYDIQRLDDWPDYSPKVTQLATRSRGFDAPAKRAGDN